MRTIPDRARDLRLPVLMYHHVGPLRPGAYPDGTVSPELFERHVRWLAQKGYVGIRPSEWLAWRHGKGTLPSKPLLLTLDDAYADITEHALPVLRRYGFGAAVYVVTRRLGGTNTWDEAHGWATQRLMTTEQVRAWAGEGIEFGAHSRTHPNLTALSDPELANEVIGSRDDLADLLGSPVVSFAYPHGFYNAAVCARVRAWFALAFTAEGGTNDSRSDPHQLRRAEVRSSDSLFDLACQVRFGHSPAQRIRRRLRRELGRMRYRLDRRCASVGRWAAACEREGQASGWPYDGCR